METQFKDSGVAWLGEIPAQWEICRTKNVYKNHKYIVGDKADEYERLALTLDGVIKRSKEDSNGLQPDAFDGYQILNEGELVFKLIDLQNVSTSRVGLSPYTGIVSPAYIILEPVRDVDLRYGELYFLSMWQREVFNHMGDDGVRSSLNAGDLLNIPFIYPPIEEQKKVAMFLNEKIEKIEKIIKETQSSIEEYKVLRQSIITNIVTKGIKEVETFRDSGIDWIGEIPSHWNISRLKYVAKFNPPCNVSPEAEDEITYTPMEYIKNGYYIPNSAKYSTLSTSLTAYQNGDIVMAKVTPCFENGNIAIMDNLCGDMGLGSSELFVFRPFAIDTKYLFYWLRNMLFIQRACSTMTGTGGLKRVSPVFVQNTEIHLPPAEEQREIGEYLDQKCKEMDSLIEKKEKFIIELKEMRNSLIFECITGKREVI